MTAGKGEWLDVQAELASLDESVQSVRTKLDEEAVKRDTRIRLADEAIAEALDTASRATAVAIVAAIVAFIGILVGVIGIVQVHDANAARQTRTVAACEQANRAVHDRAEDDKAIWHDVIERAIAGRTTDPAAIERFTRGTDVKIDRQAKARLRDCSPAGLSKFYSETTTSRP